MMTHSTNAGGGSGLSNPDSTSSSLLQRVKAQDAEAWGRLVKLYGPMVYRWCRQSGLKAEDTADVVQEVFASVITSVNDFRGDRQGSFRAWLRSITRHRLHDYLQREKGSPEGRGGTGAQQQLRELPQPVDPSPGAPMKTEDGLWHHALELVRAEFEDRTWRTFWRVAVDGQRPAEVADELDMTIHAVYQAKSRVLRRVRQELGDLEGDA